MSRGSGCATITGATATAIAAWCGAPGTAITTTIITGIVTGTTITIAGTIIIVSAGAPLCLACGVMAGAAAGLPNGRPADFLR